MTDIYLHFLCALYGIEADRCAFHARWIRSASRSRRRSIYATRAAEPVLGRHPGSSQFMWPAAVAAADSRRASRRTPWWVGTNPPKGTDCVPGTVGRPAMAGAGAARPVSPRSCGCHVGWPRACHRDSLNHAKHKTAALPNAAFSLTKTAKDAPGIFIELFYKVANVTPTFPRVHAF